jgi:cell division protein FtsB
VRELGRDISAQQQVNARLKLRNDSLDADVRDLKTGFEAIEERARSELGMIRPDEVFFQIQAEPAARAKGDSPPTSLKNEAGQPPAAPPPR